MAQPVCAVVGVGIGNGAAIARRFARGGYGVALLARGDAVTAPLAKELPGARQYACDAADPAALEPVFARVAAEMGEVETLIYNAGGGTWGSIEEVDAAAFEAAWRVNALGLFVAAQLVIPAMKRKGAGSIVAISATAARRGMPRTASFAPAKSAQRILAESMARTLWPAGIHVAVVPIDGVVDLPRTRERLKDKPDDFFVKPDDVAETVWNLVRQPRSTWSFELEVRPYRETW